MRCAPFVRRVGVCLTAAFILASVGHPQPPAQVVTLPQVDFGSVPVGSSKTLTYRFQNPWNERITINTAGFAPPVFYQQDPPFYLSGVVFPSTLPPGGFYEFEIRFAPTAEGVFQPSRGPLTICVNTERTGRHIHYEIPLRGEGVRATPSRELVLLPLQDTFVDAAFPREPKGSDPYLRIGTGPWGNHPKRTLIQFDLSQIPAGVRIVSATLRLYKVETSFYDVNSVRIYSLHRITEEWDADTAVWGTRHGTMEPEIAYDPTILAEAEVRHLDRTGGPEWVEWDVTADVRRGMPHYGWMLKDREEHAAGAVYDTAFCSTEENFWQGGAPVDCIPRLVVVYQEPERPALLDHTMCKDVQADYPYDPIDPTYAFSTTDEKAVSWVKLGPVHQSHRVEWKWYSPDGRLYFTWTHTIPDPGGEPLEWYKTWCWIEIRGGAAASLPGDWRVDVYLDEQKILTERFTIQR